MWQIFNHEPFKDFQYIVEEPNCNVEFSSLTLHDGVHKIKREPVSVFRYNKANGIIDKYDYAVRNLQRLKTLKHPNILAYVDNYEDEKNVFTVTEQVKPLFEYLKQMGDHRMKNEYIAWGVMNVMKALDFCHRYGKFYHNNVGNNAVYVNTAGEWKLGEFGFASESDSAVQNESRAAQLKKIGVVNSEKLSKSGTADIAGVAVLIAEAYAGLTITRKNLGTAAKVPECLENLTSLILQSEEKNTDSLQSLLNNGRKTGNFFQNRYIDAISFLEEIHTKNDEDRFHFFSDFHYFISQIPENVAKFKVLPLLIAAYEYGCEGALLIPSMLQFFEAYSSDVDLAPFFIKLFQSKSRSTRKLLLDNIGKYVNKISSTVVNDSIFPLLVLGFRDSSSVIRLGTVNSVEHYVSQLQNNKINRELLPLLAARLVEETDSNVRKASVEMIGKIARYIQPRNRKTVLLTVITKALKDSYPPTRETALTYIPELLKYFSPEDWSTKILPELCVLTLDHDKIVRTNTFKAIRELLVKLEMVEFPVECPEEPKISSKTWTEWAVDAVSSKFTSMFPDVDNSVKKGEEVTSHKRYPEEIQKHETLRNENIIDTGHCDELISLEEDSICGDILLNTTPDKLEDRKTKHERIGTTWQETKKVRKGPVKLAKRIKPGTSLSSSCQNSDQ